MFKDFFQTSDLLDVPVFVMLFFMCIFAAVLIRICSRRRTPHYQTMARLPLDETPETEVQR